MSVDKTPALPFYGKEFYDDERVWLAPLEAQGLYIALLWHQWQEGSIPADIRKLAALVGKPEKDVRAAWESDVRQFFAEITDGRLANKKLEKVRSDVINLRARRSIASQQKTSKKPTKDVPAIETATASEEEADSSIFFDDFETIWAEILSVGIPEPVGKKAARRLYDSTVATPEDCSKFKTALANYRASDRVKRGFIQNASTWFNDWQGWADRVAPVPDRELEERILRDEIIQKARLVKRDIGLGDATDEERAWFAWVVVDGDIRNDAVTFEEWLSKREVIA